MKICRFFLQFFFEILPKFSDFVNSDDHIGKKSYRNLLDYIQFLFKNDLRLIKKQIFSSQKIENLGNSIHDYAHSFFREDL